MPRPDRIRLREAARAEGAADTTTETTDTAPAPILTRRDEADFRRRATPEPPPVGETEPVDTRTEVSQPVRTGQVVEDDPERAVAESVARRMGWVPKEEWKRDPANWTDAPEFLEQTPARLTSLQERQKRWGQIAEEQVEQARRDALATARAEHEAAVRTGDVDAAGRAADKMAKVAQPHQATVAWVSRNPWFRTDPDAQAIAANAMKRAEAAGATVEDQLQAGEAAVKRRFPEYFDDAPQAAARAETKETKLSDVRPAPKPPTMAPGSRGVTARAEPKEKGWMDIPSADRFQMQRFVKSAMRKGLSEKEATARLANDYWKVKT